MSEESPAGVDPYIDWWARVEQKLQGRSGIEFDRIPILGEISLSFSRFFPAMAGVPGGKDDKGLWRKSAAPLPIPAFAKRPADRDPVDGDPDLFAELPPRDRLHGPGPDGKGGLDADTVIVGVIDCDIPLGHNRFRDADGKSRILAAWQMLAPWGGPGGLQQEYLPFGREVYKDDLDALLFEHGGGSFAGWLDEQAFNAATGVLDNRNAGGRRGIAKRASHGAHVMDLAAGADPVAEPEFARRVKIVAVNIPDSSNFGAPGTFLDEYLRYAILRVADLADALWLRNNPGPRAGATFGYPIVLNISFGKQAGAKSNLDRLPALINDLLEIRKRDGCSRIDVVMPAGNDNHLQCNAFLEPDRGEIVELNWRVLPEDRSSNFVEVWTDCGPDDQSPAASLSLVPPGGKASDHPPVLGVAGHVRRQGNVAAVYCEKVGPPDGSGPHHFRYVLCLAPTYIETEMSPAPSGAWKIRLRNERDMRIQCRLSVQTDQQVSAGGPNNLRSYFDDPAYRRFEDAAGLVESESYPDAPGAINTDLVGGSPVRRHGTMNSSAANRAVARVGGYRMTDGRPAFYSATGRGRTNGADDGTLLGHSLMHGASGAPTAALPTDDGPAHFGILAAGSANGSMMAMRGTSFASAQAARCVAIALMDEIETGVSAREILGAQARLAEGGGSDNAFAPAYPGSADIDQAGWGRLASPIRYRVARMGER
ncbi:MAG: hypothetical protein KF849_00820 [Rhizobiaceae bacterium]|nr:hypothetical protein [Rhizobiaceae bacterium]